MLFYFKDLYLNISFNNLVVIFCIILILKKLKRKIKYILT